MKNSVRRWRRRSVKARSLTGGAQEEASCQNMHVRIGAKPGAVGSEGKDGDNRPLQRITIRRMKVGVDKGVFGIQVQD
jgi:hypothetical protein